MKNLFVIFLILFSATGFAQKIGGFYKGTLYNDSTKMTQNYELALAEYRGKIMGYSYVTFVANDTFYYGIRKIKARIEGDNLIVEDDKMIANNFPESPAKRVGRTITISLKGQEDSLVSINGTWKTNQTKTYYSVAGSAQAARSEDSSGSRLFAHLKELNLMPDENNAVVVTETKQKEKETKTKVKENADVAETKVKVKEEKTKIKSEPPAPVKTEPVELSYTERKKHLQQTIDVVSDSLVLSFYDNGVVDGDSVSVYLNNQPIITNILLKTVATKKIIHISGETELLLVAENLGSIPPNTGLITIKDGDKLYQVNFSADMQTNASIILRKKN